jgi:hypothetical protein
MLSAGRRPENLDPRGMAGCCSEAGIACDQGRAQSLGECNENRIVRREVVTHFPDPIAERAVRVSDERQPVEVCASVGRSLICQLASRGEPAQRVKDLDVDQMRGVEVVVVRKTISACRARPPFPLNSVWG